MVVNREVILTVCGAIIALSQIFGCIDIPSTVVRTLDDIEYRLNEPDEMSLYINGINPQRSTIFGFGYCGYEIKTTIVNTGKSGYANITCNVYDLDGVLVSSKHIYPSPHFERDSNKEFRFNFEANELSDKEYKFDIIITDQIKDS